VSVRGAPLIAVVDDDAAVCEGISSLLRSAGYRCVTFASAEALLASSVPGEIDCILLDIRLPGMSGLDLHLELTRIKRAVPVIYVTAASEDALRQRALSQGAIAVLTKTFKDHDLLNAIGSALHGGSLEGNDT
jgi:FixJ family two-component response regulator